MNDLGSRALNKTLSPCIVQYYILMSGDGEETYETEPKKLSSVCVCMCICVWRYWTLLSAILLFFINTIFSLSVLLTTCSWLGVFYCWLDHIVNVCFVPLYLYTPLMWFTHTDTRWTSWVDPHNQVGQTSHKGFHGTQALFTAQLRKL